MPKNDGGGNLAATKLIALHINKGKTLAKTLLDRLEYAQNPEKTEDGTYISSYECDPKTVHEEFLLTKREYQHKVGRQQKNDVIAYMIRQSFKPGEITPEEATESAMNWVFDLLKASTLLLLILIRTKLTFIIM